MLSHIDSLDIIVSNPIHNEIIEYNNTVPGILQNTDIVLQNDKEIIEFKSTVQGIIDNTEVVLHNDFIQTSKVLKMPLQYHGVVNDWISRVMKPILGFYDEEDCIDWKSNMLDLYCEEVKHNHTKCWLHCLRCFLDGTCLNYKNTLWFLYIGCYLWKYDQRKTPLTSRDYNFNWEEYFERCFTDINEFRETINIWKVFFEFLVNVKQSINDKLIIYEQLNTYEEMKTYIFRNKNSELFRRFLMIKNYDSYYYLCYGHRYIRRSGCFWLYDPQQNIILYNAKAYDHIDNVIQTGFEYILFDIQDVYTVNLSFLIENFVNQFFHTYMDTYGINIFSFYKSPFVDSKLHKEDHFSKYRLSLLNKYPSTVNPNVQYDSRNRCSENDSMNKDNTVFNSILLEPMVGVYDKFHQSEIYMYINNFDLYIERNVKTNIYWIPVLRAFLGGPIANENHMTWLIFTLSDTENSFDIHCYEELYDSFISRIDNLKYQNIIINFLKNIFNDNMTELFIQDNDEKKNNGSAHFFIQGH